MLEPTFTDAGSTGTGIGNVHYREKLGKDKDEVEVEAAPGHRLYAALPTCLSTQVLQL